MTKAYTTGGEISEQGRRVHVKREAFLALRRAVPGWADSLSRAFCRFFKGLGLFVVYWVAITLANAFVETYEYSATLHFIYVTLLLLGQYTAGSFGYARRVLDADVEIDSMLTAAIITVIVYLMPILTVNTPE